MSANLPFVRKSVSAQPAIPARALRQSDWRSQVHMPRAEQQRGGWRRKFWSAGGKLALLAIFLAAVAVGVVYAQDTGFGLISEVRLTRGAEQFVARELDDLRAQALGAPLITFDVRSWQARFANNPHVVSVVLRKQFPGTLEIQLETVKPAFYFLTPNAFNYYAADDRLLNSRNSEGNLSFTETERFLYAEPQTFRNTGLRELWFAESQEDVFDAYRASNPAASSPSPTPTATPRGAQQPLATPTPSPAPGSDIDIASPAFQEFLNRQFAAVPLNQLATLYARQRAELRTVLAAKFAIWDEFLIDKEIPVIYSLVEAEDASAARAGLLSNNWEEIRSTIQAVAGIQQEVLFSPTSVLFETSVTGRQVDFLVDPTKDLQLQRQRLQLIQQQLGTNLSDAKRIDVREEKVIVRS